MYLCSRKSWVVQLEVSIGSLIIGSLGSDSEITSGAGIGFPEYRASSISDKGFDLPLLGASTKGVTCWFCKAFFNSSSERAIIIHNKQKASKDILLLIY